MSGFEEPGVGTVGVVRRQALRRRSSTACAAPNPCAPIRTCALVDEVVETMRTVPGFSDRRLMIEVDSVSAHIDREGLAIVLTNRFANALKFSVAGDEIRLTAGIIDETDAGGTALLELRLSDSGSRIDPDDLDRIFDRFYRGQNAERQAVPGTGIGLGVSRAIVEAHGGTLHAEDVPDGAS